MKKMITNKTMTGASPKRGVNTIKFRTPFKKCTATRHESIRLIPPGHVTAADQANVIQPKNHHPKMIFIVEDNGLYAKSLQYYLESRFHESEIRVFSEGELCIQKLHLKPDYIVMDYFLNSKVYTAPDGLMTIRRIRKKNRDARIILLSTQQNMEVTVEAVKNHHCNYVVKSENAFEKIYTLMSERK